jgi:hypothetical protein
MNKVAISKNLSKYSELDEESQFFILNLSLQNNQVFSK